MAMYTNSARWFCKEFSGHDKVWPEWANDTCPKCKKEFTLNDEIIIRGGKVYHYDCLGGRKPPFTDHICL